MNFLQVTVARILVKVSPGKLQKTRKGIRFIHFCFAGGLVVLMTVHSMMKLLKEKILASTTIEYKAFILKVTFIIKVNQIA